MTELAEALSLLQKMDRETALVLLGLQRDCLRDCTDPDKWDALADDYMAIGAESNAESCHRRAAYYRATKGKSFQNMVTEWAGQAV